MYMKLSLKNKILITIIIIQLFLLQISCINLSCITDSDCQAISIDSTCGPLSKCICDTNFIVTCNIPATPLTNSNLNTNINQQYTYFTITPQSLNTYLTFKLIISSSFTSGPIPISLLLWGDSGYLTDLLPSGAIESANIILNPGDKAILQTGYYSFSTQPNGQSQYLILGIQVISPTSVSYPLTLYVTQQQAFDQDIFKIIITVLLSILSISCLILLIFCIYNRHRLSLINQRIQQQKQPNNIQHFPIYMPIVCASRVNIPLQVCSICLIQIISDDMIRVMLCRHIFHVNCIDQWCIKSINCPICRQEFNQEQCMKILPNGLNLDEVSFIKQQSQQNQQKSNYINESNQSNQMKRNDPQDNSQTIQDNTFININKQNQINTHYKTQQRQRQIQMVQLTSLINNINNINNETYNSTDNNNNNNKNNNNKNYFATNMNNHKKIKKNYQTQQSRQQYSNYNNNNNNNNNNKNKRNLDQQISQDVDFNQNLSALRKPIL